MSKSDSAEEMEPEQTLNTSQAFTKLAEDEEQHLLESRGDLHRQTTTARRKLKQWIQILLAFGFFFFLLWQSTTTRTQLDRISQESQSIKQLLSSQFKLPRAEFVPTTTATPYRITLNMTRFP